MGKPNFSDEIKRDAAPQITERGYPVADVSQRLGVRPPMWCCRRCTWQCGGVNRSSGC